uniref:HPS3 biogenesis of lysosomal organelles complex 2 subunit 1 n=1 Tax=Lates calcarifer TaxID=8187 RepID=A0A4W6F700_LATCA
MVHVYNCHPFASQQIVQVSGAVLTLIQRDYLVTIEEKNSATYLRAYTNWRYQAEEKARVGVRLLGHLLRGASVRGGVQMEIIEIPLSERPVAMACCSVTGDLLVGCENTLVLFTLRRQNQQNLVRIQLLMLTVYIFCGSQCKLYTEAAYLLLCLLDIHMSLLPSKGNQSVSMDEPACMFCFFSLPNAGYLYSLKGGVELLSAYQYPEKVLEAVLTDHLLHVITRNALQCFTVRCAAVAARIEDPYIDTTMRACPPCSLEVLCVYGRHVILLSTADTETSEETERTTQRRGLSRKWTISSPKETSAAGHGWNLYVVDTVSPFTLYQEMVEYSQHYAETSPQAQSLRHLLSEAHLLLRASLLQTSEQQQHSEELEEALRQNCAQLGDCFSRASQKDCHLALPYYRMSGLSVTEVMVRNRPHPSSPHSYGPGFLFYLKHYLLEETEQTLNQESADEVIDIFGQSDPSELITVCASPSMINVSPARTLQILQRLEDTAGVSVPLTITMATMMLRLDDLPQYTQLINRHAEMLLVYGFIEEPRLLLHGGGQHAHVRPTALAHQLAKLQPGLLVAAMVALHENNKVQLEQADHVFKVCEMTLLRSSLLCGPSLSIGSVLPLLERLSEETLWGFSLHLLCATRRGQYDSSIEKLLDRCPQAIIAYANHQLQDKNMALWWQKLLPELCNRTRAAAENSILLAALKETLVVVAMETSPTDFLELIPDDGTAAYFLPHLLTCSQRHLLT